MTLMSASLASYSAEGSNDMLAATGRQMSQVLYNHIITRGADYGNQPGATAVQGAGQAGVHHRSLITQRRRQDRHEATRLRL